MQTGQESRLVDPLTGSFTQDGGSAKKLPAELLAVVMLLLIEEGSIPGAPQFTSRIYRLNRKSKSWPAKTIAEIDRILRPWQAELFDGYQRKAWFGDDGIPRIWVQIRRGDITADTTFPVQLPAAAAGSFSE
jgi:hypothetical protein